MPGTANRRKIKLRITSSRSRSALFSPGLVAVMLLAIAVSPLAAQEEPPAPAAEDASQRQFFDQVDVDLANIDVTVNDRQGRPVTGLTREDFAIFVDDRRVELTNFFEVSDAPASTPDDPTTADPRSHPPGTTEQLNLAIVVDNRNIRPENRKLLLDRLREYLADDFRTGTSGRQIMLATLNRGLEVMVPFTEDRERISRALGEVEKQGSLYALLDSDRRVFMSRLQSARLRTYSPRGSTRVHEPSFGSNSGQGLTVFGDHAFDDAVSLALKLASDVRHLAEQRYQQNRATMAALAQLSEALGGLPGRKALLYLSDGLPARPADSLIQAWVDKYQNWALKNQRDFELSQFPDADQTFQRIFNALNSSEFDLRRELRELTDQASGNRVAFYPISNGGRNSDLVSASVSGGSVGTGAGGDSRGAQHLENFARDASILQLADDTGGQALIRNANVGELLDRADQDFRYFYALGYARPGDEEASKSGGQKVRVEVKRDDVVARYGKTYRPSNWRGHLGAMTLASALFATEDNAFEAALEPGTQVQQGKRFRVPIMLTIPFDQIRLVYKDDHYRAQLTALVVVRNDDDGGYSEPQRIDFPVKIPGRRIMEAAQQQAGYLLELEMDGGPKRIAVGIRDHIAQTESTVHLDLVVGETL